MDIFVHRSRVLQISLIAILSSFVVELVFGVFSNSLALITDSIHALLDSVVTIILLLAAKMALRPPDAEHTYGHGKMESLGGLLGGIAILFIAGFFIYESIQRLQSPIPAILPSVFALIAGAYTIGIDVFRIALLKKSIKKIGGVTLKADFYHAFLDFGSTTVAIVGIIFVTYGFYYADFIAALVLGIVLAVLSVKLIHKTAMDLTDIISPKLVSEAKEIAKDTDGVLRVGPILMRKSGDVIFGDITISLRADVSFDKAHEISDSVEENISKKITNSKIIVHFEPSWDDAPRDARISELALSVKGVKNVHNSSSHHTQGKIYASLHVMVDENMDLESAHTISEIIEEKIRQEIQGIDHTTIHLEPHVTIPENLNAENKSERDIEKLLEKYKEIKKITRIAIFYYKDIKKIEIDCSFDKELSIQKVHDLTSDMEQTIRKNFKNSIITIHPEPFKPKY